MNQTKICSLIESSFNTFIGFFVTLAAWPFALWLYDVDMNVKQTLGTVAYFTVISVARGYVIRRWFNGWLRTWSEKTAARIRGWFPSKPTDESVDTL